MSDAPETIWMQSWTPRCGVWGSDKESPHDTEYRRADLPPTLSAAMQLPEVRELRDAATQFAKAAMSGSDLGWPLVNLHEALAPFTEASA